MRRVNWTLVLTFLFLLLLGWYLVYTEGLVRALRADVETMTQMFSEVQAGLSDPDPLRADQALVRLQEIIVESGVPLVLSGPGDTIFDAVNLSISADLSTTEGQSAARRYARRLDARNPPVGDPEIVRVHFGDPPEIQRLRWIPWLQVTGLLLVFVLGVVVVRSQRKAEAERAWNSMARELAHQLGTPISSLQGWVEVLRLSSDERPRGLDEGEVARAMEQDVERLERVSRRFELIGREVKLEVMDLRSVVADLEGYLRSRMPRLGSEVALRVQMDHSTPPVLGSPVLLAWALENLVKNALDAMAGRNGAIVLRSEVPVVGEERDRWVHLYVEDEGGGVDPELQDNLFEAGVTSKQGGWGVGLALTRRIVERVHGGRVELHRTGPSGSSFRVKLPAASG